MGVLQVNDYVTCPVCGGNYDHGELKGGICDDCRRAAEKEGEGGAVWEKAARCIKEEAGGQMALMPAGLNL